MHCAARFAIAADIQKAEAVQRDLQERPLGLGSAKRVTRQFAGAVFGLSVAYDMIDDPAIKASISDLLTRKDRISAGRARLEIARTRLAAPTWTSSRAPDY